MVAAVAGSSCCAVALVRNRPAVVVVVVAARNRSAVVVVVVVCNRFSVVVVDSNCCTVELQGPSSKHPSVVDELVSFAAVELVLSSRRPLAVVVVALPVERCINIHNFII